MCRIKVLHIILSYYPRVAGAEVFAQKIAEFSVQKGHEVCIITGRWKGLSSMENINGVYVYRVNPYMFHFLAFLKALKLYKKFRFNIVHAHLATHAGFVGFLASLFTRTPLIVTVQGGDLFDYSEHIHYRLVIWPILIYFMIRLSLNFATIVHAVSKYTAVRAKRLGAKKIIIIPNGVDTDFFAKRIDDKFKEKLGIRNQEKVIITVSRLTQKNGLITLIKSLSLLKDKNYRVYDKIKVIIVGDGPQEKFLKNACVKLGVSDRVTFTGGLSHEDIPRYLSISDIFVRTPFQEGFGIAFLEAMSCQLPIIATNVGGIVDFVKDGINGILIKPGDDVSLARAIVKLVEDEEYAKAMAEQNRKTAVKYDWHKVCKKVLKMYLKVLHSKKC
ncbi:TPA: glycosyltransferase family 1 protein [Candidatus Poribacteria bacterium]|nr:glycosyltransferase family 1 protein [Candidatus Poribacteria bacterium]